MKPTAADLLGEEWENCERNHISKNLEMAYLSHLGKDRNHTSQQAPILSKHWLQQGRQGPIATLQ